MRLLLPLLAWLLLSGCASIDARVEPETDLSSLQHIWVERNLSDNHAIGTKLVRALEARGLEAELGPMTMLSKEAQAVLAFRDYWSWDFGDHLTSLEVTLRHPRTSKLLARARFQGPLAVHLDEFEIIDRVLSELLAPPAPPTKK